MSCSAYFLTRLAGGSASASLNWAKSGLNCSSSSPKGTIFPLNTVTLSRVPPLEYNAPLVCVASPACGILKYMLTSFLIKLRSQIPFHIPTKHHTPSCTTNTTTEDFHSLHRSKVSKFDGIRLYARLFKTLERPRFPHIPYYHIPEYFTSEGGSQEKKPLQVHFFFQYSYLPYAKVFLVYDPLCGVRWSVSMCVECAGVLWSAMTPPECHMNMCGRKSPERRIPGHNSPNSTERMLVVVI